MFNDSKWQASVQMDEYLTEHENLNIRQQFQRISRWNPANPFRLLSSEEIL